MIDNLTNSRADKWDYFINMNVIGVLNLCCYYKDKQRMEDLKRKEHMRKIKR